MTEQHWNAIFASKPEPELGWHESGTAQTWKFLSRIPHLEESTVFLAGAGTSVLAEELIAHCAQVVLNDISAAALERLRLNIGANAKVTWMHADISAPLRADCPAADVWIDRAALHFLIEEPKIATYFDNLRKVLNPGGYALLAEFAPEGAPECAGLGVHRYSVEEMSRRLGLGFSLVTNEPYVFINPWGEPRPYTYALFQRS